MRPILVCAVALFLAACATTDPRLAMANIEANLPTNYKALIIDHAKRDFFDPYSIRSARISEPRSWGKLILVCVEANAKNRLGGYTGIQPTVYEFINKELSTSFSNNVFLCPSDITYRPFPDLEAIK